MKKSISLCIAGVFLVSGAMIGSAGMTSDPLIDPPYGPTEGYTNVSYTFSFIIPIELPNPSEFMIQWYWGDLTWSEWLGPYSSETVVSASHAWNATGYYDIEVDLKDVWGAHFKSDHCTIHISPGTALEIRNLSGFLWKIGAELSNVGQYNATNISWAIYTQKLTSPILFGKGTIPLLAPGGSENVQKTHPVFGLGWFKIILKVECTTAASIETRADAFGLYFFILHTKP
jgi:hypothetical protein